MATILKDPPKVNPIWTPRALVLAGFASGLAATALALLALQVPGTESETAQIADLQVNSTPETPLVKSIRPSEPKSLAQELRQAESEVQQGAKAPKAPKAEAPAPAMAQHKRVQNSPVMVAEDVEPPYPALARQIRVQGPVDVTVLVNEKGVPTKVIAKNGNAILQKAAVEAAQKWRFHPALVAGKPVASDFKIHFDFKLS